MADRCVSAKSQGGRTISRDIDTVDRERHAAKMRTPESKNHRILAPLELWLVNLKRQNQRPAGPVVAEAGPAVVCRQAAGRCFHREIAVRSAEISRLRDKLVQPGRKVFQFGGQHVDDLAFALQRALGQHQRGPVRRFAEPFPDCRADDQIGGCPFCPPA